MTHGLDPAGQDLTAGEVAKLLRLSTRTTLRYIGKGEFAGAFELDGGWRIPQASVIEFIRRRQP